MQLASLEDVAEKEYGLRSAVDATGQLASLF